MIALVPALAGALIVAGLLGVVAGLRPTDTPTTGAARAGRLARLRAMSRRTRLLLLTGLGAGVVAWLVTGWVLALVIAPVAAVGLPMLLAAPPAAARIARLEAMEEWTRSLSGVLTVGVGLEQALLATLRSTPEPIAPEVTRLVARLRARWVTEHALRAFADELDDATGDLIAANLILGARRRGAGLASVLEGLAESVAADVRARRQVEADRAKPRATARWVTLISVAVLVVLAISGSYVAPYRSPLGQVILVILLTAYVATLVWMRRMATGQPPPRFLTNAYPALHRPLDPAERIGGGSMTTGLQLMILAGGLVGLGVALLVIRLLPAEPDLADALGRLTPTRAARGAVPGAGATPAGPAGGKERLGLWALRVLPPGVWVRTPTRELALLRIPLARFYGDKITFALPRADHRPAARVLPQRHRPRPTGRDPGDRLARTGRGDVLHPELQRPRRREEGPPGVHPGAGRLHRPGRVGTHQRLRRPGRPWRPPPGSASRGCSPGWPRSSPAPAGPGSRRGTRCTPWPTSSGCPSWTTSPTSCGSPARKAPASTPPCGPARPRCVRRCSTTRSPKPTRSANG